MKFTAFEYIAAQPLMVLPETLEAAVEVALRLSRGDPGEPGAVEARRGRPREAETEGVSDRDGVRTIPVTGPIFRYADLFTDLCGGTTLEGLARDLQAAVDDPNVRAILLSIDSPGGEAAGIGDFAAMVRDASKRKPLAAFVGAMGASAAYWIACGAPRIVMAESASVGSIGVVLGYPLKTARDRERSVEFVSSQSPRKRPDPQTEAGRAAIQERVDDLADVFIGAVAAYRGATPERVASDFGRGGVLIASKAVAAGMADAIGTYESTLADLARKGRDAALGLSASASADPPTISEGSPPPMTFLQKLLAMIAAKPEAAAALTAEETAALLAAAVPQAATSPAASAAAERPVATVTVDTSALETQLADAKKKLADLEQAGRAASEAALKKAGDDAAEALVASGRFDPADRATLQSLFALAVQADGDAAKADGHRAKLAAFLTKPAPKPAPKQERIASIVPSVSASEPHRPATHAPASAEDPAILDNPRMVKALEATDAGQAVLEKLRAQAPPKPAR